MANYSKITDKTNGNRPIQVESAIRDGEGKNIVNNYSKQNGYYANMGVGQADELSTTRQIENPETACPPIVMGITGGDAEIKTGIENFEYLEGNSFAFNQLVEHGNFDINLSWSIIGGSISVSSNKARCSATNGATLVELYQSSRKYIVGHKVLLVFTYSSNTTIEKVILGGVDLSRQVASNSTSGTVGYIGTVTANQQYFDMYFYKTSFATGDYIDISNCMAIDLTLIYGAGNEPTTVDEFKSRFPLDYYAYNSGTILSAKTNALISRGRQQWDEQWEVGSINNTTGQSESGDTTIRSKNYMPVINGETYYFRVPSGTHRVYYYDANKNYLEYVSVSSNTTFEIPANASYIRFRLASGYGTTYHNDITISIYFEDGEGYDDYYAYSQDSVALPNIELRAIGDLKDIAYASGGGKRKLGYVDLGDYTWTYTSSWGGFRATLSNLKQTNTAMQKPNIICARYVTADKYDTWNSGDKILYTWNNYDANCIIIKDTSFNGDATAFKNSMSNVYLLYELATETDLTENDGWDDTINVDNYGTLEFTTDPQQVPQVPQPYFIKYTISLKELLDSIYVNAGGDADDIVYQEELQNVVDNLENGSLVAAKAEVADNLTPYDEESGEEQTQPFALQGTGCGNGESVVDTGSFAQLKEKQGNSVVVNNIRKASVTGSSADITISTNAKGNIVVTGTVADINVSAYPLCDLTDLTIANHKYLVFFKNKETTHEYRIYLYTSSGNYSANLGVISQTSIYDISSSNAGKQFRLAIKRSTVGEVYNDEIELFICDLTLWFGSNDNIPSYLLAHPESFFNYYRGSLAYNVGTLVNANGQNLKCIGRNQWDEQWELGSINVTTGANDVNNNCIRSKNYIPVLPNTSYFYLVQNYNSYITVVYYDSNKNFIGVVENGVYPKVSGTRNPSTTPSNACYMRFNLTNAYGTTYNHDITISIYYEDESGYNEYYPYEVLTNVDTGTETLRSAGSVRDYKTPDGTVHRLVGVIADLSTLNWAKGAKRFYAQLNGAKHYSTSEQQNFITTLNGIEKYVYNTLSDVEGSNEITINTSGELVYYYDMSKTVEQLKSAISGKAINYELAEETTEQGTPFNETLQIDDFGSMYYDAESYNGVPQGNAIFYPVDYKAMLDSLNNRIDGDVTKLVIQSELKGLYFHTLKTTSDIYINFISSHSEPITNLVNFFTDFTNNNYFLILSSVNGRIIIAQDVSGYVISFRYISSYDGNTGAVYTSSFDVDLSMDEVDVDTVVPF